MSTRADIHRPSTLIPADYSYALSFALPGVDEPFGYNVENLRHMMETLPFFGKARSRCDVCGAYFRYGSVFRHVSGEHIIVGWECASQIDGHNGNVGRGKNAALQSLERARKFHQRRGAQRLVLKANPGLNKALKANHYISRDLRESAIRTGSLSEKQVKLAFDVAAREQEKATEKLVPVPAEGRQTIVGKVVSVKTTESNFRYGFVTRMTVKVETPDGAWLVNGTLPQSIPNADLRGKTVEFSAEIQKSDKPHFGFFKRPTKAKVIA